MRQILGYFLAQIKRVLRLLPGQLLADAVVCICAGALACLLIAQGANAAAGTRYRIGMVGDLSDTYLGFGIAALQEMDDSRLMIELVGMSEEEAEAAFLRGDLYAVVRVPEGALASIVYGENTPITYTAAQGQKGLGTMVMGEITDIASTLVTASQSAIYAMQRMLSASGRGEEISWETDKFNLSLINLVLARSGFGEVEVLGYADGLSLSLYYFCGVIFLFLLLSGLLNGALFVRKSESLPCFLKARGVGAFWQVFLEYTAYFSLVLAGFLVLCLCLFWGLKRELVRIPEWEGMGALAFTDVCLLFFPVAVLFAAMQFFLYEAAAGIVNGILMQLICGISMGYLSGYFYPSAFFPKNMQRLGDFLPSGGARRFVEGRLLGEASFGAGVSVFAWTAVFLVLAAVVRAGKIKKG